MKTYDEVTNEIKASVLKQAENDKLPELLSGAKEVLEMRTASESLRKLMASYQPIKYKNEAFKMYVDKVENTIVEAQVTMAMLREAVIRLVDIQLDETECAYPKCLDNEDERCPKLVTGERKEMKDI